MKMVSSDMITYCDQCGRCCRFLHYIASEYDFIATLDRGDGVCKYLENNLCSIYDKRPLLCNSIKMYELFYRDQYTWDQFQQILKQFCVRLKEIDLKDEGSS